MISEKTKLTEQEIEKIKLEIQDEKEILADIKRNFQLEIAVRCKRDAELDTFITELKMWVFKIYFFLKICSTVHIFGIRSIVTRVNL